MKIEILHNPEWDTYDWNLYTGADGADEYKGTCLSIGECFENIIKWELLNGKNYYD